MQINATDVRKTYGSVSALDGLTLEIPDGSTVGLLGTNGAGKTTFFKLLVGLDRPDSGDISVGDMDVSTAGAAIRRHVGYLPEHVGFPDALTGREVLSFHARMHGCPRDGRVEETLTVVGLSSESADRRVGGYSNGMRRRLGLATAVISRPSVLVLDEPTAGLDPRGVNEFHELIERVRSEFDATVVIASHALDEIERLCDRIVIIDRGTAIVNADLDRFIDLDSLSVRLRPGGSSTIDTLIERVGSIGSVTVEDEIVVVRCHARDVPSLFGRLDTSVEISDVRIDRDRLQSAFLEAIAEGTS